MCAAAECKLRTSPHLVVVPRGSDYAVYHRWRGGLCLVDKAALDLLNHLKTPTDGSPVHRESYGYHEHTAENFIRLFSARGFIINEECDEDAYLAARIQDRRQTGIAGTHIAAVQLVISNACNFKCRYCFEATEHVRESVMESTRKTMLAEDGIAYLEQVIALARRAGRQSLAIQFFGGEPLVNWKVMKKILTYFGRGQHHQLRLYYVVVTNGSIMTDDIASTLKEFDVSVVVSLDSPENESRPLANGKNSSAIVERGLALAKRYGNRLAINAVYGEATFNEFNLDLVDFALDHGIFEIGVILDLDRDFYIRRSADDIVDTLCRVYHYGRAKGIMVTGYWHMIFDNLVGIDRYEAVGYKTCSALGCQLSIEPSGEVFACKACCVGLGHAMHLSELLHSKTYMQYNMRSCESPPPCIGCEIEHFCSGLCVGSIEKAYGNIQSVESAACKVYRKVVARLISDASVGELPGFYLQ